MTEIYFSFDTEDFTSDHAADAILYQAKLLSSYGIRGNFNIVGYLARELVRNRRFDVLDALKEHTISFHSLRHSYHPTINEYTDIDDFAAARKELLKQECEGMGMVRAATGLEDRFTAACPPGDSFSYAAMYTYAELGIPLYVGSLFNTPDGSSVYYCNQLHTNYDYPLEYVLLEAGHYSQEEFVEELAAKKRVFLYNHPNKALYADFWDIHNYFRGNLHPMHQWEEARRRPVTDVMLYFSRLTSLIEALKKDSRFRICSCDELAKKTDAVHTVTKDMLPRITAQLKERFACIDAPVSLSVADCFFAAKHFLTSAEPYTPGLVHGFLKEPEGTKEPVTLTKEEVLRLAASCTPDAFLPPCFEMGGKVIGPADLLFAMLDIASGQSEATVLPKTQQCDISEYPALEKIGLKGSWIHCDSFEDRYLSDRLRLQAWTIRHE